NHNLAKEEKEADEFAGCILMDEKEIRNRYKKATSIGMTEDTKISILANIFNVSKPAMYTRLKNLELIKS
ncbi:ImmA/IrrE family metallo-endopeptidase, partial [Clostridium botulinum]|nr:ImmA/IrrE family metallo-endopeptidase [Clostridium botulinum C/D]